MPDSASVESREPRFTRRFFDQDSGVESPSFGRQQQQVMFYNRSVYWVYNKASTCPHILAGDNLNLWYVCLQMRSVESGFQWCSCAGVRRCMGRSCLRTGQRSIKLISFFFSPLSFYSAEIFGSYSYRFITSIGFGLVQKCTLNRKPIKLPCLIKKNPSSIVNIATFTGISGFEKMHHIKRRLAHQVMIT